MDGTVMALRENRDAADRRPDDDPSGDPRDPPILREAKKRFKRVSQYESAFRTLYIEDVKFANGDSDNGWQWPNDLKQRRDTNKRPALTINKTQTHVRLVTNDARKNKPSIKVRPVGEKVSYDAAQTWEGLFRHIEYISAAQQIYDGATDSQVEGGIGYWRVTTDYVDDESFDQEMRIAPVQDHLGVLIDSNIKQKDGSDARFAFIFEDVPREDFEEEYPDAELPIKGQRSTGLDEDENWVSDDSVRIAEYYRIIETDDELIYVRSPDGEASFKRSDVPERWQKMFEAEYKKLQRGDESMLRRRKIKRRNLEWYKIAGNEIIDRRKLKGSYIPVVRLVGRERKIEGKLERKGLVRSMKDPQRMYNYNDLSIDTPIPTPRGWTTMGAVKPGDAVLSDQGLPTTVLAQSPVFINRRCYSVKFDDGSEIIAGGEHLWTVEERGKRKTKTWNWSTKTLTTNELVPKKHFIWVVKPLDLSDVDLPIDPYILGAWLGDGYSASAMICSGLADMDEMEKVLRACRHPVGERKVYKNAHTASWRIGDIKDDLKQLGILNNKHIPALYLRASRAQREALLQGLMDTDGHFSKNSRQNVFVTVSPGIAAGFAELVRSLGLKATYRKIAVGLRKFPSGKTYECQESYRFSFSSPPDRKLYRLPRKDTAHNAPRTYHCRRTERHRISSITEVPSVPTKCITVDAPSKLYLAGPGMVPTHNTSAQVEAGAMATKTKWVGPAAAFEGNEVAWRAANQDNAAYLTYRHTDAEGNPIPPPAPIEPPQPVAAYLEGMHVASSEMEMTSGQYQPQFQNPNLERSPKAIGERQRAGDTATYDFIDSLGVAIRYTAIIIMDQAPYVYDTARVIKILARDGTMSEVHVQPDADEAYAEEKDGQEENQIKVFFNPTMGRYAIEADVGPAYATQREEAWHAFVEIVSKSPEALAKIGDLMFRAADFPMADQIAERFLRDIKNNAPWLLDDETVGPLVQKLQGDLAQANEHISELMQQLAETKLKLRAREEKRVVEDYKAETDRMLALGNTVKDMGHDVLKPLIRQTLAEMMGFTLEPLAHVQQHAIDTQLHDAELSDLNGTGEKGSAQ
jgi:hypothetical protein